MSKAKLYKVKLIQGFNAKGRRRAGIELQKNVTIITELTDEQLEALNDDSWIEVSDAPEGSEPTAPGDTFSDDVVPPADDEEEVEVSADMKRPELEAIAKEVGIEDPANKELYPNKPSLVEAIKKASESEES